MLLLPGGVTVAVDVGDGGTDGDVGVGVGGTSVGVDVGVGVGDMGVVVGVGDSALVAVADGTGPVPHGAARPLDA